MHGKRERESEKGRGSGSGAEVERHEKLFVLHIFRGRRDGSAEA